MADSSVIKEYLVGLGFKVDEKGLKNFTGQVENAGKAVFKFVAAIQGAALTIGAGVAAFASNLEALNYAAQKTGSSATNLKAFGKAAENFGASTQDALQSVQALARWMRETPESEGYLQAFGAQTRDANGNLKDTTDLLLSIGDVLRGMSYPEAKSFGDFFRINEDTLRAIMSGEFAGELEKQRESLKDSGFDQAAKDAHAFMVQLRELQTYIESFALKVQQALMQKLGVSMDSFASWFAKNGPMIADRVADILLIFLKLAEVVGPALMWIVEKLIELDGATDGWSTKAIGLLAVMQLLGGFAVIGAILKLAGAFGTLGGAMGAAATASVALRAGIAGVAVYGALELAKAAGLPEVDRAKGIEALKRGDWLAASAYLSAGDFAGAVLDKSLGRDPLAAFQGGQSPAPAAPPANASNLPRGIRNNNPGNLNFAGQRGATKEGGPNGRFAVFPNAEAGLAALARQLQLYAQRGIVTTEAIISKWAPPSENNTKAYIANVSKALGVAGNQALDLSNPETLSRLMDSIIRMENGSNPYASSQLAAAARGVTIQQTNNISVNGSSDPGSTASAVARSQERVNSDLTRNLQTAVN